VVKPSVTLPDPERVVVDLLVAAGYSGVSTDFPSVPLSGSTTKVQVDLEASSTDDYPVTERAQVRVVAHAAPGKRSSVKVLASALLQTLYSFPGNASIAGIVPVAGRSAVSVDPDTGNVMCWLIVRVDLIATTIAP
jgi:hypothetical protein